MWNTGKSHVSAEERGPHGHSLSRQGHPKIAQRISGGTTLLRKSVREVEELSLISAGLQSLSSRPKANFVLGLLHIFDPLLEGGTLSGIGLFEKFLQ